jgi:hypothetical protein
MDAQKSVTEAAPSTSGRSRLLSSKGAALLSDSKPSKRKVLAESGTPHKGTLSKETATPGTHKVLDEGAVHKTAETEPPLQKPLGMADLLSSKPPKVDKAGAPAKFGGYEPRKRLRDVGSETEKENGDEEDEVELVIADAELSDAGEASKEDKDVKDSSDSCREISDSESEASPALDQKALKTYKRLREELTLLAEQTGYKLSALPVPTSMRACTELCAELREAREQLREQLELQRAAGRRHAKKSRKVIVTKKVGEAVGRDKKTLASKSKSSSRGRKTKKARLVVVDSASSPSDSTDSPSSSSESESSSDESVERSRRKKKKARQRFSDQGEGKWGRKAFDPTTLALGHPHQGVSHRVEFGAGHRRAFVGLRFIASLTRGGEQSLGGWFEACRFPSGQNATHGRLLGELKFLCYLGDTFLREKSAVAEAKSGSDFRLDMIGRRICMLHAIYEGTLTYAAGEALLPVGGVVSASISEATVVGLAHLVGAGQKARKVLAGGGICDVGGGESAAPGKAGSGSGKPNKPSGP